MVNRTIFMLQDSFILKKYFNQAVKAEAFYDTIFCGILHQAETKENSAIWYGSQKHSDNPFELSEDGKSLRIFWHNFHPLVKDEFNAYCTCLRTNHTSSYRENF